MPPTTSSKMNIKFKHLCKTLNIITIMKDRTVELDYVTCVCTKLATECTLYLH